MPWIGAFPGCPGPEHPSVAMGPCVGLGEAGEGHFGKPRSQDGSHVGEGLCRQGGCGVHLQQFPGRFDGAHFQNHRGAVGRGCRGEKLPVEFEFPNGKHVEFKGDPGSARAEEVDDALGQFLDRADFHNPLQQHKSQVTIERYGFRFTG